MKDIIYSRQVYESKNKGICDICANDNNYNIYISQVIIPIIANSNIVGSIILFSKEGQNSVSIADILVIKTLAKFISMQIDI